MKLPFVRARRPTVHPTEPARGVVLAPGTSGSTVFLEALAEAARRHPVALAGVRLPSDRGAFKHSFPEVLVRFEAHRAASSERVAIARTLVSALHHKVGFADDRGHVTLSEHLACPRDGVRLDVVGGRGAPSWSPEIPWRKDTYSGAAALRELAGKQRAEHLVTPEAERALLWVADRVERGDGKLDLRGQRFALLGAGAELAPTEMLLHAGADVLWIDRAVVPERLRHGDFAGRLFVPSGAGGSHHPGEGQSIDLLADPGRARAAILAFWQAGDETPLHLGLYAYAPGKGRELRLAAVMDAIAKSLPNEVVASVAVLVSPTTPGEVHPVDRAAAEARRANAQVWKKALERAGLLQGNPHETFGDVTVSRTVVSLQGPAYQAAQYLAKMMSAEAMLVDGIGGEAVTVSANVAGITATRSLLHPLFQAGFLGAPRFKIEIYDPATTRALAGLLVVHDVANPLAAGAAEHDGAPDHVRARRLTAQAFHGGCRSLGWVLEPTIRVGALIGLGKKPSLMAGLIPRKKS